MENYVKAAKGLDKDLAKATINVRKYSISYIEPFFKHL